MQDQTNKKFPALLCGCDSPPVLHNSPAMIQVPCFPQILGMLFASQLLSIHIVPGFPKLLGKRCTNAEVPKLTPSSLL